MTPDPRALARTGRYSLKALGTAFITGLAFLAPVLLTAIVLTWVFSQLASFVGPDSLVGQGLTAGGNLFTGRGSSPLFSFTVGVGLLVAGITALGFLVRDKARIFMEEAIDGALGRVPVLGNVYRPVAQLIRGMSGHKAEAMATMAVCRVIFGGGVETVAFLASNETFDLGGGPAKLVLIPTAPVPIGGALLLVAVEKVQLIPDMKFEDLAKLYLTMGMTPPPQLRSAVQVTPESLPTI
jgi:uncharacterized membrane protein